MREVSAKSLVGMPVYSITEGESIGVVRNIILDPEAKQLLAFAVDRRGWYRDVRIIAYSKVKNIGTDVITIEEKNVAQRAANLPKMVKYMHQPSQLVGNRVISDNGHTLGKVEEYYLDSETGEVCRLDVSGGVMGNIISGKAMIKGKYIITIGISAIVVNRACLNDIETVDSNLKVNLQEAKEKAGQAWQSTVNTSKKLGKSVSAKLSDMKENYEEGKRAKQLAAEAAAAGEAALGEQPTAAGKRYRFSLKELLNREHFSQSGSAAETVRETPETTAPARPCQAETPDLLWQQEGEQKSEPQAQTMLAETFTPVDAAQQIDNLSPHESAAQQTAAAPEGEGKETAEPLLPLESEQAEKANSSLLTDTEDCEKETPEAPEK